MAKIGINLATGTLQQPEMIVGIDLGTTNSLVAIIHPATKQPLVLKEHDSSSLVPSVIHFNPEGNVTVGEKARSFLVSDPANTIFSVKRLMGKAYNDIRDKAGFFSYKIIDNNTESLVKIQAGEKFYSPVDLSSFILKELKTRAEHILKTPVNKAVVTVPAYFNDAQRQATRDAGKLAGLDVLRIINEPTAASLAYGLGISREEEKTVAVYDLGGGTFDISVLRIAHGVFEVLSTRGDTYLGGDDFDQAIINYWKEQLLVKEKLSVDEAGIPVGMDTGAVQELRLLSEEAKKQLSTKEIIETRSGSYTFRLERNVFESLVQPLVDRTIACCKMALEDAGIGRDDIDEVIMVGGSTRVPLVKRSVAGFFGRKVHDALNPDEIVALGAAIQADILAGNNKEVLLLDITPLSLGIETMGGLMDILIPRNSKIPSRASRQYTTQKDGQGGIKIAVFQGERDLVKDNRKLGEFILSGIPAMPAGMPKVEISFLVNADGILIVKAKELRSGTEQSIQVQPQYGLTDEEVEKMLLDAISHAGEDMHARALAEARAEGSQLIEVTQNFIARNRSLLSPGEEIATLKVIEELTMSIACGSKDDIHVAIEKLNDISRPYAERLMDDAIGKAMKGKNISG